VLEKCLGTVLVLVPSMDEVEEEDTLLEGRGR